MFTRLETTFKVLTPMFLGGADQMAEIRPSSVKGALRFWFRAVSPLQLYRESALFGGAGRNQGQAPFFMEMRRVKDPAGQGHQADQLANTWKSLNVGRFRQSGKYPLNGLGYLGWPFPLNDNARRRDNLPPRNFIAPGESFCIRFIFPRPPSSLLRQGLCASIWLLGHVGAFGSRSKRGFGAISLLEWRLTRIGRNTTDSSAPPEWEEMHHLPLLHSQPSPEKWHDTFQTVLSHLSSQSEFETKAKNGTVHHPHLGNQTKLIISSNPPNGYETDHWAECLNDMGLMMQKYRQLAPPDYHNVKQQLLGKKRIISAPDRASFGLPLKFQYSSIKKSIEFGAQEGDRHASLLHLRPVLVNGRLYPLFLRLDGDIPAGNGAKIKRGNVPLKSFQNNAMDRFLETLKGGGYYG